MTDLPDLLSETDVTGSLFDPKVMEELKLKHEQGLWFWLVDWEIVLYRDPAFFKWKAGPFLIPPTITLTLP
jgi:hypothetical protein